MVVSKLFRSAAAPTSSYLTPEEKDRYKADIRATNILLQGLPKDIYTLINHYTDTKYNWDNVKMLLEGSELTKDDRESQLYDEFEHIRQSKGETIHEYYVRFMPAVKLNRGLKESNYDQLYAYLKQHEAHANENKKMFEKFVQQIIDPLALMSIVSPSQTEVKGTMQGETVIQLERWSLDRRMANANPSQAKLIIYNAVDADVDEPLVQDLALTVDNIFQADQCDAFDSDVDEAPTAQTMFMANLSSADPIYDEANPSYDSDILSEVQDHDNYQDAVGEHHEVHEMYNDVQPNYVVDSNAKYMSDSNMISYDQYVKDNTELVIQSNVSSMPNDVYMLIINEMHEQAA
ncbi:hypothetical protein Tco_0728555 [Tanacetum coccineum]|uniref:Integrase, catalytic region, zinc finger, CCHC-type, peptidase aspartic, catalytic n=1 Tax=Tanacetum coccineum TaxID=301880 RepID=A0ABQ4YLG8_9ASTR